MFKPKIGKKLSRKIQTQAFSFCKNDEKRAGQVLAFILRSREEEASPKTTVVNKFHEHFIKYNYSARKRKHHKKRITSAADTMIRGPARGLTF